MTLFAWCLAGCVDGDDCAAVDNGNGCEPAASCVEERAEQCNMLDDDCDGECDEAVVEGCRVGVHRSYGHGNLYTTDLDAADADPFTLSAAFYFHLYADPFEGTEAVFLCRKANEMYFVTASSDCEGIGTAELMLGYWATSPDLCNSLPLYRLHNADTGDHLYTRSAGERDNAVASLGYQDQGVFGYVW